MKTDIDDRLNPQAPPPVPLHMAGLLKNFIWNETLKITARKAITAQRTTFPLPLAPFPRSAQRAIHFQLNWNACFLTTTFATYYTIAHFPMTRPVAQLSWSSSVGAAVSFSTICSHISPATCRNHPRCRIRTQLVVVVVVVIRARVTQNKAIFLQNMDILGLWICWKIKMAATSQCVWERVGERERGSETCLHYNSHKGLVVPPFQGLPPFEMVELFAAQSVKLWTKCNKSNNLYIDMIVSNGQQSQL